MLAQALQESAEQTWQIILSVLEDLGEPFAYLTNPLRNNDPVLL
jgi:hypothetical protein